MSAGTIPPDAPVSARVLIVEDGDEYLDNVQRFLPELDCLQAHDGAEAIAILGREPVDLVYLDMRFDRIEPERLLGTPEGGAAGRALSQLQNNQGLYILEALSNAGYAELPVILAYDFSREERRFQHLLSRHPRLTWVPDAVTPAEIRARVRRLTG